jgi:hypothetical protein
MHYIKRLLLILLLFSRTVFGQDYSCIIPTDTSYFINEDGYLRGIRIDNVQIVGSDTIYFPFRTMRRFTSVLSYDPYDTSNGSWLGRKIAKQPDGIFRFNTFWLDTVFINTQAMPGDSWTFYDDTSMRQYIATVISVDTMTINGAVDSIKNIQITAYLGSIVNLSDSVNGFEILLSKHHGFASVFDMYMFPYFSPTGISYRDVFSDQIGSISPANYFFKQIEFHVPTLYELHDFSVGDVFVSEYAEWNTGYTTFSRSYDSIVSKTVESPTRTVYTSNHRDRGRTWSPSSGTTYSYYEGEGGYLADTTPAFSFRMPEEAPEWQTVWHYRPNDTSNCSTGSLYSMEFIVIFEGCPLSFKYKIGLPQLRRESNTPPWPDDIGCHSRTDESLIFFVKNGIPCGPRTDVAPIVVRDVSAKNAELTIYPNPANETLNLKGTIDQADIFITDITGRQIISTHSSGKEASIDISQLAPGPYIIRVNDTRQTFIKQ